MTFKQSWVRFCQDNRLNYLIFKRIFQNFQWTICFTVGWVWWPLWGLWTSRFDFFFLLLILYFILFNSSFVTSLGISLQHSKCSLCLIHLREWCLLNFFLFLLFFMQVHLFFIHPQNSDNTYNSNYFYNFCCFTCFY